MVKIYRSRFLSRSREGSLAKKLDVQSFVWMAFLLVATQAPAQNPVPDYSLRWEKSIPGSALYKDRLHQLYVVDPANELVKLSTEGLEQTRYNQDRMGPLGLVDPFDPFFVVLFYPEFQVVQVLDRTLNLQWSLDFNRLDLFDITTIAASNDKQIWAIDRISNRLLKFDQEGDMRAASPAFSLLSTSIPNFTQLEASGSMIYAFEPGKGFWIFDQFGQFVKNLSIPGMQDYQLLSDQILYHDAQAWYLYDMQSHLTRTISLPLPSSPFSFVLANNQLFVLDAEKLQCFNLANRY